MSNENIEKKRFQANYKVFYGEQTRYEDEILLAETMDEAQKLALIYELNKNIDLRKNFSGDKSIVNTIGEGKSENWIRENFYVILDKMSTDDLESLVQKHKEDRSEYEIWDLRGITERNTAEVILEALPEDDQGEDYGSIDCVTPDCKGIMTIGQIYKITFPEGVLSSNSIGKVTFLHYTCDRCGFKLLITEDHDGYVLNKLGRKE